MGYTEQENRYIKRPNHIFVLCCALSHPTLCNPMDCSPPGSSVQGIFPGKNSGVGCHFLLQGIFHTQGIEPASSVSPALQADSLLLTHPISSNSSFYLGHSLFWITILYQFVCTVPCSVAQVCPTLYNPVNCSPPGSSAYGSFQARIMEWVAISYSSGSSQPRDQTGISCITTGKPTNTGMSSLLLLQCIFLTQESNWGLPHCRWIFYQLSYEGSPPRQHIKKHY